FDADKGEMTAKPTPIATGIRVSGLRAHTAASRSGLIVFSPTVVSRDNELVIVDRAGHAVPLPVGARNFRNPRFSPDGRRLVVNISRSEEVSNTGDVWTYDISSQRQSRLTFDDYSLSPAWTHDRRTIAFTHREPLKPIVAYRVAADGSGTPAQYFTTTAGNPYEFAFTPDGKSVVYRVDTRTTKRDVMIGPVDSPQVARALLSSPFEEHM